MIKSLKFILCFLLIAPFSFAQVNDNFNDGDFTVNPIWSEGSVADFKDTLGMLRSNNLVASSSFYISTPSSLALDAQWEFFVNLKFATSSTNYVDIYLLADNANLTSGTLNGYFVRVGNTTDEIYLYKMVGGIPTKIIDGADGIVSSSSNNLIKIKVVRDVNNLFTLIFSNTF